MKNFLKYIKSTKGQSLAEFAVTTAMMATLATTAAPKFSGVGEGAKEKKTLADIDKIMKSANNFYNAKVTTDGRGRFPGQSKYNVNGHLSLAEVMMKQLLQVAIRLTHQKMIMIMVHLIFTLALKNS